MDEFLLSGLIGTATSAIGWFLGRKQANADAKNSELDATEKAVGIWRSLAQDLKKEVDELRTLVEDLRAENAKLRVEVEELKQAKIKENG